MPIKTQHNLPAGPAPAGPVNTRTLLAWGAALILGTLLVFYLGWVYLSNWYGFYGLDASELEPSVFGLLTQGSLMLVITLGFLLILFTLLFVVRLVGLAIRNLLFGKQRLAWTELFSFESFFRRSFHFVILLYAGIVYWFLWTAWNYNTQGRALILPGETVIVIQLWIAPSVTILLLRALADLLGRLPRRAKKRLKLKSVARIADGPFRATLGVLLFMATSVLYAAMSGLGEASVGYRPESMYGALPRVNIASEHAIPGLEPFRIGCGCDPYRYGPLAYLAEEDGTLILTRWKPEGEIYFRQFPELYRIQRSQANQINVVPAEAAP
jgi:hypothetical protein